MADPTVSTAAISAAFPAPPPFYKFFTQDNLSRLSDLRQANPSLTALDLPPELHPLLPPAPPSPKHQYRTFGATVSAPDTQDATPKDPPDPRRLVQTTRQLLLAFLSLINSLATDPNTWAPKWDEMRALFTEANGIINDYRPHQARESLISMMEEHIERCKAETQACLDVSERVKQVVEGIERGDGLKSPEVGAVEQSERNITATTSTPLKGDKSIWNAIQEEVGTFS
ncbi:MAG: hypothetical protein Q9174_000287 [Haloplaca sp. 1 TL-2023]